MSLDRIIWLASVPESGNTRGRTFLANDFQPEGEEIDINSLHRFTTADLRQGFFDRAAFPATLARWYPELAAETAGLAGTPEGTS